VIENPFNEEWLILSLTRWTMLELSESVVSALNGQLPKFIVNIPRECVFSAKRWVLERTAQDITTQH